LSNFNKSLQKLDYKDKLSNAANCLWLLYSNSHIGNILLELKVDCKYYINKVQLIEQCDFIQILQLMQTSCFQLDNWGCVFTLLLVLWLFLIWP